MEQSSSTHVVIQTTRSTSIQSFCTKPLIRCHHYHVPPNPFALLDTPLLREPTRLPPLALILYSDRTVRYGPQQTKDKEGRKREKKKRRSWGSRRSSYRQGIRQSKQATVQMGLPSKVRDLCQICNWTRTVTTLTASHHSHLVDPTPQSSLPVLLGSGAAGYWLLASPPPPLPPPHVLQIT